MWIIQCTIYLFLQTGSLVGLSDIGPIEPSDPLSFSQQNMLNDFEFITNSFEICYGPSDWKKKFCNWDLNVEKQKIRNLILPNPSLSEKDFHKIIKDFCLGMKDYHVIPQFYSTESSRLPFQIQSFKDRFFISYLDDPNSFPISVGDELLFFDGIPISDALKEFRENEIGSNYLETDKALAEFYFTLRIGSLGHVVPKGEVQITYRNELSDTILSHHFQWSYEDELITNIKNIKNIKNQSSYKEIIPSLCKGLIPKKNILGNDDLKKQFETPHYRLMRTHRSDNGEPSDLLGARKSKIPPLGKLLWESKNQDRFHAYLFLMDDLTIGGYIRIPSYSADGSYSVKEFADIIQQFQKFSDVLVVDQTNNGGGNILYLYALLGILTDRELEIPMHSMKLKQQDVYLAIQRNYLLKMIKNDRDAWKQLGKTIEGLPVNLKLAQDWSSFYQFIIDQWNSGKLVTDFCYLYGIERIAPNPKINYTKPMIVLTNALDFSCADFFPAILQDNKRAKIMGTRTAGAGGYKDRISFPNLIGIEDIEFTGSFSLRPNGLPIENLGVTPDIIYEVTYHDIQNNYVDYKQKILDEIGLLLSE